MLEAVYQKALVDDWHDRGRLKNLRRIGAQEPVPTQVLRHTCANDDELRHLEAVQDLVELEPLRAHGAAEGSRPAVRS